MHVCMRVCVCVRACMHACVRALLCEAAPSRLHALPPSLPSLCHSSAYIRQSSKSSNRPRSPFADTLSNNTEQSTASTTCIYQSIAWPAVHPARVSSDFRSMQPSQRQPRAWAHMKAYGNGQAAKHISTHFDATHYCAQSSVAETSRVHKHSHTQMCECRDVRDARNHVTGQGRIQRAVAWGSAYLLRACMHSIGQRVCWVVCAKAVACENRFRPPSASSTLRAPLHASVPRAGRVTRRSGTQAGAGTKTRCGHPKNRC